MNKILFAFFVFFLAACANKKTTIFIDNHDDWNNNASIVKNLQIAKSDNSNGVIDLMGNGALLLDKLDTIKHFQMTSRFKEQGSWTSKWLKLNKNKNISIESEVIIYGNTIDMRSGWIKFSGNPVISGENKLLPLNKSNITNQTILLPAPGGVPQDQSILLGTGKWEGKWLLFFNHTPNKWPYDYYWSFAVAESLEPFKQGINPFKIDSSFFPLHGPINGHAPNDWLEVNGTYYAPDETHDGESHMWISNDIVNWKNIGPIKGILGNDPGICYDGMHFFLFNEKNNYLTFNRLNRDYTSVVEGDTILNVGDHTGDPDLGFFNNLWHMFFDDGEHLHYHIGYAKTTPENFPYGWELENDIYGPYNPDQGQNWDNDNKEGNDFGTGDADFAIQDNTLFLFTERPIGLAYKELTEIYKNTGQEIRFSIEIDDDGDNVTDKTTEWINLNTGIEKIKINVEEKAKNFRIKIDLNSNINTKSPLIKSIKIEC